MLIKHLLLSNMYRHMLEKNHSIGWKNASFLFNNKNKEVFQMVESALISKLPNSNLSSCFYSLPDNIAQGIYRNFVLNDPFLYFNIQVVLFVSTSFQSFTMLLEFMPRWHTLSRSLFLFIIILLTWWGVQMYAKRCPVFSNKNVYGFINMTVDIKFSSKAIQYTLCSTGVWKLVYEYNTRQRTHHASPVYGTIVYKHNTKQDTQYTLCFTGVWNYSI